MVAITCRSATKPSNSGQAEEEAVYLEMKLIAYDLHHAIVGDVR